MEKGGFILNITVDKDELSISVWLTVNEQKRVEVNYYIDAVSENLPKGYRLVVYRSGIGSLADTTKQLLIHNRFTA